MENTYRWANGIVYHKCLGKDEHGICDFKTNSDGYTEIECRQCGFTKSISEFIEKIANYFRSPDY